MNLLPFADHLQFAGVGTQAVDIFINSFPANRKDGILLRLRPAGVSFDHDLPGYLKGSFQLIVRGADFAQTQTKANAAVKALTLGKTTLGGLRVNYARPTVLPTPFPLSQGGLTEFSTDIEFCVVDGTWA